MGPLSSASDKSKAGWLGTWLGAHGREIFRTMSWEKEEHKQDPDKILENFETYVRPRKNKRIARHNLKLRHQRTEESFDQFLTDLRLIIMDCDYTDSDDILIDSIIDGVADSKVQERLLDRGENLNLAKAIEICQQYETSKKQVRIVRGQEEDASLLASNVHELKFKHKTATKAPYTKPATVRSEECKRCGTDHTKTKGRCPAFGTTCAYCKKENHWARVCIKKTKRPEICGD